MPCVVNRADASMSSCCCVAHWLCKLWQSCRPGASATCATMQRSLQQRSGVNSWSSGFRTLTSASLCFMCSLPGGPPTCLCCNGEARQRSATFIQIYSFQPHLIPSQRVTLTEAAPTSHIRADPLSVPRFPGCLSDHPCHSHAHSDTSSQNAIKAATSVPVATQWCSSLITGCAPLHHMLHCLLGLHLGCDAERLV